MLCVLQKLRGAQSPPLDLGGRSPLDAAIKWGVLWGGVGLEDGGTFLGFNISSPPPLCSADCWK